MAMTVLRGDIVHDVPRRPHIDLAAEVRAAFLARYSCASTRETYAIAIDQWYAWCAEWNVDPMAAQRGQIEMYARALELTGRKPATVAGKLHTLSGLYRFAVADGMLDRNPMIHVRIPQIERRSTSNGLTRTEYHDVLESAKEAGAQHHAIIGLLGENALRVSSLCGIDVEHLGTHMGLCTITFRVKGGRVLTRPTSPETGEAVRTLALERGEGPLFVNNYGNRMERKAVDRIIQRHVKACGITKRITPHSLRHTHVTLARNAGVPDREIMATTGHLSASMMNYYDRDADTLERGSTLDVAVYVARAV